MSDQLKPAASMTNHSSQRGGGKALSPWKRPQLTRLDILDTRAGIHPPPERGNHRAPS